MNLRNSLLLRAFSGLLFTAASLVALPSAHATSSVTIYIAASGSTGDGSSCSAPSFAGANSLQSAINSIPTQGKDVITINICPGIYQPTSRTVIDSTTVSTNSGVDQSLIIQGNVGEAANTIIDGSSAGTLGLIKVNTYANVEFQRLTFRKATNNTDSGGAIDFDLTKVNKNFKSTTRMKIHDSFFSQNKSTSGGGAIHATGDDMGAGDFSGVLEIYQNEFYENSVNNDGGAISSDALSFSPTNLNIHNNKFVYNYGGRGGGAVNVNFAGGTIVDNYFYMNNAGNQGRSIYQHGTVSSSGNRIYGTGNASINECSSPDNGSTSSNNWANNSYCNANQSNTATTFTLKTNAEITADIGNFLPQSPSFTISASNSKLTLNLSSRADGGSAITNYEYSTDGTTYTALSPASGAVSSIELTGLTNGTTYPITLKAITTVGKSLISSSVNGTPVASAPGTPTIGTARATGKTTASVDFTAPGSDGGATISNYYCYSDVGGFTVTLSQSGSGTCNFTGLTENSTYKFRIRARNSAGYSGYSSYSATVTPNASAADTTAADKAAAAEAERKRQKDLEDAKAALIAKVSKGETVVTNDVTKANLPVISDKTNTTLNNELKAIPQDQKTNFDAIAKVVTKIGILDVLQGNVAGTVSAREVSAYDIIPANTPQKTSVVKKLQELPVEQRDTIAEINAYVAAKTQEYQARLDHLAAVKAKIAARNG